MAESFLKKKTVSKKLRTQLFQTEKQSIWIFAEVRTDTDGIEVAGSQQTACEVSDQ